MTDPTEFREWPNLGETARLFLLQFIPNLPEVFKRHERRMNEIREQAKPGKKEQAVADYISTVVRQQADDWWAKHEAASGQISLLDEEELT